MTDLTQEEWDEFLREHQYAQRMFSVLIEGAAVVYVHNKKKRARVNGSRGKYISECILFAEKHRQSPSLIKEAEDEAFKLQLRVFYLERLCRENGISFDLE